MNMLKPVVFFLALTGYVSATTYSCSCYCPTAYTYVGTTTSFTCSNTACANACYNYFSSCMSLTYSYGTCMGSTSGSNWDLTSYTDALGTGAIIAIVAGGVASVGLCIAITVIIIIVCKRKKRAQIWALQPHQQQPMMMQPNYTGTQQHQQWTPGVQPYPPAAPMTYGHSQYPPPYAAVQPINIQS